MNFGPNQTKSNVTYNGNPLKTIENLKFYFEKKIEAEIKISKSPTKFSPYAHREHLCGFLAAGSAWCSRNGADSEMFAFSMGNQSKTMRKQWFPIVFPLY